MKTRLLIALFVLVVSVIPNACLVEQVIATVAEIFPQGYDQESQHHEGAIPSHSHDQEGHEEDFCCDSQLYLYVGTKIIIDFEGTQQTTAFINTLNDFKVTENHFEYHTYLHNFRKPPTLRGGDKFSS